jgi:hypothetical protein
MHSDWFNRIEILQGRWQHGKKVGYCYPSRHKKTLCKWDTYVPLVTKRLRGEYKNVIWFLKDGSILLKQGFVEIYSYVN